MKGRLILHFIVTFIGVTIILYLTGYLFKIDALMLTHTKELEYGITTTYSAVPIIIGFIVAELVRTFYKRKYEKLKGD